MEYLKRLLEPSTWGGLSVLVSLFGVNLSGAQLDAIWQVVAAIFAAMAVFLPERAAKVATAKTAEPGKQVNILDNV